MQHACNLENAEVGQKGLLAIVCRSEAPGIRTREEELAEEQRDCIKSAGLHPRTRTSRTLLHVC